MANSAIEELQAELKGSAPELLKLLSERDAGPRLTAHLPKTYAAATIAESSPFRVWELCGVRLLHSGRVYEALGVFWQLYQHMLRIQNSSNRIHKGILGALRPHHHSHGLAAPRLRFAPYQLSNVASDAYPSCLILQSKWALIAVSCWNFGLVWLRSNRKSNRTLSGRLNK
jgi:hypothetical protein